MKIFTWLKKLSAPRLENEDLRRQESILNILLIFSIFGFLVINIIRIIDHIIYTEEKGIPLFITLLILFFFCFLFWLSKHAWLKTASSLLIITFALPMVYSFISWGSDVPAALLLAVLVIILSGVLLGARFAFISTLIISSLIVLITDRQTKGLIIVSDYWRKETAQVADAIVYSVLLLIIAAVAWLFCREIKKSLDRAHLSEKLLREERDLLEIKVEERTKELLELEAEKIKQFYRLAEFGKLSSGIFHDLVNPLTAVALNLEQINNETSNKIISAKTYLHQALLATNKMADLIASIKKQIIKENTIQNFSINKEIEQTIQILAYKARRAQTNLTFLYSSEIKFCGDALKFSQVIINILANAIEACENVAIKNVTVSLNESPSNIEIIINDTGAGIAPENLEKIFASFFSTKKASGQGLGIGLALTKDIIEKDFLGQIKAENNTNEGAKFIIIIPKQNKNL